MLDLVAQLQQEFEVLDRSLRDRTSGVTQALAQLPVALRPALCLVDCPVGLLVPVIDALTTEPGMQ